MTIPVLTFIRNFSDESRSKYFLTDRGGFREVLAEEICDYPTHIVTHDYWMICKDIFNKCGRLPKKVIDLDELWILVAKDPSARLRREKFDIADRAAHHFPQYLDIIRGYKRVFYNEEAFNESIIQEFHAVLNDYYIMACSQAWKNGEFLRFIKIEVPCQNICANMASRGIKITSGKVTELRHVAKYDFYEKLKNFSDDFDQPLEIPSDNDIINYASRYLSGNEEYSLEFISKYLPQIKDYSSSIEELRELDVSRGVLNSIPVKDRRVFPIIDTQGSRTSRIAVRNPFLQSLAKRHRHIICADSDKLLSYVDFDQFEVGIMAALSGDAALIDLFRQDDMYESFRINFLNSEGDRKAAKIMFLAYAYGMKRKNLPIVGAKFGISRGVIRTAFDRFNTYEMWKQDKLKEFRSNGYVETSFGSRFYSKHANPTKKEELSAISQIVQGEGSLIFKKTLIALSEMIDVEMLLPMHDALLFQHVRTETPSEVIEVFKNTMTDHFDGRILGKASLENFYPV